MTTPTATIEIMSALPLPEVRGGGVPEWVHVAPLGEVTTYDGRGPYLLGDPEAVIATSLGRKPRVVVDENHSSEIAAKAGGSSPARGYVVEMQARDDGIWARIDWTTSGRELMADRAYWGVSPVLMIRKGGRDVVGIKSVALTNEPNLRGIPALHHETEGEAMKWLTDLLGLSEDAGQEQITAAIGRLGDTAQAEMQAEIDAAAPALGLAAGCGLGDIVAAARAAKGGDATVTALQSEVATLTTALNTLREGQARERAETCVDTAIREGRVGLKPLRDHYVSRHMETPDAVEREIAAMPVLAAGQPSQIAPTSSGGALTAPQSEVARLMGVTADEYEAALQHEREEGV